MNRVDAREFPAPAGLELPRLGFLGLGWIGRNRLAAVQRSGAAAIAALADPDPAGLAQAGALAPQALRFETLDELLQLDLDGIVIATPSAQHAGQVIRALEHGLPVFCQKPLSRNADEAREIATVAQRLDLLVGIDLSYRNTLGLRAIRRRIRDGEIGRIHAADLVFHNAYGPDASWSREVALAGGGCLIDLGTHLVDALLWTLGFPSVESVTGRLWADGRRLDRPASIVEDFALADIELRGGVTARLACSWRLHAGQDAVIDLRFHGTRGGLALRNLNGSFYDFVAEQYDRNRAIPLTEPGDDWGGRTIDAWVRRLSVSRAHDPTLSQAVAVAEVIDALYGR